MAYTPQLDKKYSGILRRFAWAMGKPMTRATVELLDYLPHVFDKKIICKSCKDKTFCDKCIFFGKKQKPSATIKEILSSKR